MSDTDQPVETEIKQESEKHFDQTESCIENDSGDTKQTPDDPIDQAFITETNEDPLNSLLKIDDDEAPAKDKRNVPTRESNFRNPDFMHNSLDGLRSPEKTHGSILTNTPVNRINLPPHIKMVSTEPIFGHVDDPPGLVEKKEFYIYQNIPKPSTPLRVWRGYYGNIYFHPVRIESPPCKERIGTIPQAPKMNRCTPQTQRIILNTRWNTQHVERQRRHEQDFRDSQRDYMDQLDNIRIQKRAQKNARSMLHLDRKALFSSKANPQDIAWFEQSNNTGTLRIAPRREESCYSTTNGRISQFSTSNRLPTVSSTRRVNQKTDTPSHSNNRKICHGSVSRKLFELRQQVESSPLMKKMIQ